MIRRTQECLQLTHKRGGVVLASNHNHTPFPLTLWRQVINGYVALLWALPTPKTMLAVGSDWAFYHPVRSFVMNHTDLRYADR